MKDNLLVYGRIAVPEQYLASKDDNPFLGDVLWYCNVAVPESISKKWVINLASKDLSPSKVKLLQRGPKFAVTSPTAPFTKYIAVTKQICDRLGENTDGVDCSEYYQKTKDLLQDYKQKHASHPNITKEEREAIKTLKEDDTWVVLTADKAWTRAHM